MGHQGIDRTLDLLREIVYWPSMAKDTQDWITKCHRCQVAKGDYTQPKPKIGHSEAHNPLDLVCLNITKIHPSKKGKENILSSLMLSPNLALPCALRIKQQKQ